MTAEFKEHDVRWTRELSSRFWGYKARAHHPYFSEQVGSAVVRSVLRAGVPLKGNVLDFGCGPGHLLARLVERRIPCEGVDFSDDSIGEAITRLQGNPYFRGATQIHGIPTHLASAHYDVVFCIETIEHILEDELTPTFLELHRILRPGGHLILTTRNEEALAESNVICPECGAIFHGMQHVGSWSASSLVSFLNPLGFRAVLAEATHFNDSTFKELARRALARLGRRSMPNLIYIGRKA